MRLVIDLLEDENKYVEQLKQLQKIYITPMRKLINYNDYIVI